MNEDSVAKYLSSASVRGSKPGLRRIKCLLSKMGDPHKGMRFIHVAGTNGKGSFCAMLENVLIREGYNTGVYSTPYIERYSDCIRVCGQEISDRELSEATEFVKACADTMIGDLPTEYELLTAVALEHFRRRGCDAVILECCMGGKDDVTNVIETPLLAVITGVALDHTAFLGKNICEIAQNKSGIIKHGGFVLYGGDSDKAFSVIKANAETAGAGVARVLRDNVAVVNSTLDGTDFRYNQKEYHLSLVGAYQPYNGANVIEACKILNKRGLNVSDSSLEYGLSHTFLKARFEILHRDPLVIYDGAHNPDGAHQFTSSINEVVGSKCILVSGIMADKDYNAVAEILSEVAFEVYTCRPENPRALQADAYSEAFRKNGVNAYACKNVREAVNKALLRSCETGVPVAGVGSLYMYRSFVEAIRSE